MRRRHPTAATTVDVAVRGVVSAGVADHARDKIGKLVRLAHEPVLAARVRLTRHGDPAVPRPVVAQANLDVNGHLIRAQVEASTAWEAVDLLEARLRHLLERAAEHWEARRGRTPATEPHEWRHISEPTHRRDYFPRPEADREIVRRKSFTLARSTVDEAVWDTELLDYDFHLFTEAGTGLDSVVYRAGPTGYRVAHVRAPEVGHEALFDMPVTVSDQAAPVLTAQQAVERLNLTGRPFVFFRDADSGRGRVLYHRYDGHYGLLVPAA